MPAYKDKNGTWYVSYFKKKYTGEKKQDSQPVCYHCKCEKCGKLIHLQCEEVESLKQHMMEHHNFEMDALRTVFYGICSECRKK